MLKPNPIVKGALAKSLLAACLCALVAPAALAQVQPAVSYQRQEVQRVIDRSNEQFQFKQPMADVRPTGFFSHPWNGEHHLQLNGSIDPISGVDSAH